MRDYKIVDSGCNSSEKAFFEEKAQALISKMINMEEKASQLCFLKTEAIYDDDLLQNVELIIEAWNIGGVIFTKGDAYRCSFLSERYRSISKTPLLIVSDFINSLRLLLIEDKTIVKPEKKEDWKKLSARMLEVVRTFGIFAQFVCEKTKGFDPCDETIAYFQEGIMSANGFCCSKTERIIKEQLKTTVQEYNFLSLSELKQMNSTDLFDLAQKNQKSNKTENFFQEKKIHFCDISNKSINSEEKEALILSMFKGKYDAVMVSKETINDVIGTICMFVRSGKISNQFLEKYIQRLIEVKISLLGSRILK